MSDLLEENEKKKAEELQGQQVKLAKQQKTMTNLLEKMRSSGVEEGSISDVSDIDDNLELKLADIPGLEEVNNEALAAAQGFLDSDHHRNIMKDRITAQETWEKLGNICTNAEHRAIQNSKDLEKTKAIEVSSFDMCLLTADPYPVTTLFDNCLKSALQTKTKGDGPSFTHCVAWLSHAAQCAPERLLPDGEVFPDVNNYIDTYLTHPGLPLIEDAEERQFLAATQLSRCFELLSSSDLQSLSASDRSILSFVVCRILLDKAVNYAFLQTQATDLISNIFTSAQNEREVMCEFSQICHYLCDDMRGLQLVMECIRLSKVHSTTLLSLLVAVFIHVSERAECTPDDPMKLSETDFIHKHVEAVGDTFVNVLDVYENERSQQAAVVTMLDCALHPGLLRAVGPDLKAYLLDKANFMRRDWKRKGRTDDAILDLTLNTLITRIEEED